MRVTVDYSPCSAGGNLVGPACFNRSLYIDLEFGKNIESQDLSW
jgi:hypothetical protein